jgi:hypothetical protein
MSRPHSSREGRNGRPTRRAVVTAAAVALLLIVGGVVAVLALTGEDAPEKAAEVAADGGDAPTEAAVSVQTRVVRVAGRLRPAAERRLTRQVRSLLERFVTDAYVEGRRDFPGFTDRARRLAKRDADVTTGRRVSGAGEVALRSGRARLSVLSTAPRRPVGVTASLRVVLDAETSRRPVTVTGRLLLTPVARGWRVFGYDLAASGPPTSKPREGTSS